MNLRDTILATNDTKVARLVIPEWDGVTVFLRVISGSERDRFEESCQADKNGRKVLTHFRARFAVLVLGDEKGDRIFTDADVQLVGKKSAAALDRILEAGMAHNRMTEEEVADLEGKSAGDQSGASGTSSP